VTQPTADLAPFEQEFKELESAASAPYMRFTYSTPADARHAQALLFERGVGEFVPPAGRLLVLDGKPAGMVACLTGAALRRARLAAGAALTRAGLMADAALARRVQLASTTLLKPAADDFYLSRIAVHEDFRGKGVGAALMAHVLDEAARSQATRCVLEVAPEAAAALTLYRRSGFEEIDRRLVADPETGRVLEYVHMQRLIR
jgi:ribosomal protein S18 acetylase RimI-like enzyme